MKQLSGWLKLFIFAATSGWTSCVVAQNQTDTLSPVLSSNGVPFSIQIQQAGFSLPVGIQSFVVGTYHGKWLLLAGRINGLHGFDNSTNNFPPDTQNTTVFVVDPTLQTVQSRSLTNRGSGLTQAQIDSLSVTGAQFCQSGNILFMTGGYGADTASGDFTTKDALTAINIPGLMNWVTHPAGNETAAKSISQIFDPEFQITGGAMMQENAFGALHHLFLAFGQDVEGAITSASNPVYSGQVRQFYVIDLGNKLAFFTMPSSPERPDPNFERTDLNVVPMLANRESRFVAFSGVFTPTYGIWTVPVEINPMGQPSMADPSDVSTFKQGMNNFVCPTLELYSAKTAENFTVLMGGISYGYFQDDTFETDAELPFINQVTTIERDRNGNYLQYFMNGEYPVIPSTGSNPGNPLLFGAGATFIPAEGLHMSANGVVLYDTLKKNKPALVGYIIGGIQSTLPNTNTGSDSAASPYIFTVILTPTSVQVSQ